MKFTAVSRFVSAAALGLAAVGFSAPAFACDTCGCSAADKPQAPVGDIVEVASAAGQFGTLLAAAEAAGLVETLQSDGPLTLFAPTDEAFAKLPAGTVESLLQPENKDQLVAVLTYHVVAGKVKAKDALAAGSAETVQGGTLTFSVETHDGHDHAQVNGVNIVATDVKATNGVVHVIDEVLLPAE